MDMPQTPQKKDVQNTDEQLRHLRELVVGPTAKSLHQLREEVKTRSVVAEDVSRVLPEAVRQSARNSPDFARSLGPTLSQAFEDSVKRDPKSLADAISPIMGPAIRRSISEQIRAMVQTLNTTLDHSLSPKGWKWRFEAWRTGRPFAEVVLLHTLVYRVEQLLLIDPRTGMLMQHASANPNDDADLVTSLLSAMQDFIRDSFEHESDHGSSLRTLNTNELTLWIEHSRHAVLAAAVRGEPPRELRGRLRETLETVQLNHSPLLESFDGDTAPLEVVLPDLEDLLESEFVGEREAKEKAEAKEEHAGIWSPQLGWALATMAILAALTLMFLAQRSRYRRQLANILDLPPTANLEISDRVLRVTGRARHAWREQAEKRVERLPDHFDDVDLYSQLKVIDQSWVNFVIALQNEPGIVVNAAEDLGPRKGQGVPDDSDGDSERAHLIHEYSVYGLRDPLSRDPSELLAAAELDPALVTQRWEHWLSPDPALREKRIRQHIDFPATITSVGIQDEQLRLVGTATADFIQRLRETLVLVAPGIDINYDGLFVIPSPRPVYGE